MRCSRSCAREVDLLDGLADIGGHTWGSAQGLLESEKERGSRGTGSDEEYSFVGLDQHALGVGAENSSCVATLEMR